MGGNMVTILGWFLVSVFALGVILHLIMLWSYIQMTPAQKKRLGEHRRAYYKRHRQK